MPAVRLEAISQVALTVPNIDEAVAFYEGTLGLPLLFKLPHMALFACGETRILLGTPEQNKTKQQQFLYFRVGDIRATVAELKARHVNAQDEPHVVGQFQGKDVWLATFLDTAGTLHHLISEVPSASKPPAAVQSARSKA